MAEWGQRSVRLSLAAEIQRRLLPGAFTCEGGQFTLAAWLGPAGEIAGDSFDFSIERDTLHLSMSDARWPCRGRLDPGDAARRRAAQRAPRRRRAGGSGAPCQRNAASVDIRALMVEGAEMHPREAVQHVVLARLKASDGELKDDATAMCVDWHGGPPRERETDSGADR